MRIESEKTVVPFFSIPGHPATISARLLPKAPFPAEVLQLIREFRGGDFARDEYWSDQQIKGGVDDITLLTRRGSRRIDGLFRYLSYLKAAHSHLEFVTRYFPAFNPKSSPDAKDAISRGSSVYEMLCIAHHLYVLKSRGLSGSLLEFGCFKGYSTSCLSFACHELGMGLDVFDSFQGLPPSESSYYKPGDFAGSLDEVKRNVREFGKIDAVTFHKGFFADTLPGASIDPLCIWMDVDLESSSRDVMTVLPALRREGCVFSHEASPSDFLNGHLIAARGPDSPLVPVADAFALLGRPIRGRYLVGNTAAFWEDGAAVPVLPYQQLLRLIELL
jgi:hypothetical protein